MTDAEFKDLQRRYEKVMSDPAIAEAWTKYGESLAGDWRRVGEDMHRAIEKVGRRKCICGRPLAAHVRGGACRDFRPTP